MKARTWRILDRAIEEGLGHAYRRLVEESWDAPPDRDTWVEIARGEISVAIDEVFDFGEDA